MKIFYCCYGGTHSSVVLAWIHVGRLPIDRIPSYFEITKLPYYDRIGQNRIGVPCYIGNDDIGNEIFVIGLGSQKRIFLNAFQGLLKIININPNKELIIVNSLSQLNCFIRIGGFISRRLGLVAVGRLLTVWGIQIRYQEFIRMVKDVKYLVQKGKAPLVLN